MSKFILPTQKGSDLIEPVTRIPPTTRISGLNINTPEGQTILGKIQGSLSNFYLGQAQKYSLSINEIQRGYYNSPDFKATYTNIQGQEYINVVVNPELVESVRKNILLQEEELYLDGYIAVINVNSVVDDGFDITLNGVSLGLINLNQDEPLCALFTFGKNVFKFHSDVDDNNPYKNQLLFEPQPMKPAATKLFYAPYNMTPAGGRLPIIHSRKDFPDINDSPLNPTGQNTFTMQSVIDNGRDNYGRIYIEFFYRRPKRLVSQSFTKVAPNGQLLYLIADEPHLIIDEYEGNFGMFKAVNFDLSQ